MPGSKTKHFFEVDDTFANYTIVNFCGSGTYGEVYLAEDITHKLVALKVLPITGGSRVWQMELLGLRHYRQAIEDHKALIEVLHVGETENFFYYTMEAADNMLHGDSDEYIADTLSHRLERGGRLEPEKVLELANNLLDALEHLHENDLAHRDLKPANIVFINGQPKLSDIGLVTTTGVRSKVVGTLEFMPPELADDAPVAYGQDLYSLGKVLYCALTGLLPENFAEVPLTVPLRAWRQFKNVLLKACSPDPRQRYYTPAEFRKDLPSAIKPTTVIDEKMEVLRTCRKQHPIAWRLGVFTAGAVIAALLLINMVDLNHKRVVRNEQQKTIDFIFRTIELLKDNEINLQRSALLSNHPALARRLQLIADNATTARAAGDMEATERHCQMADMLLSRWSEEEFQKLQRQYQGFNSPTDKKWQFEVLSAYSKFAIQPFANKLSEASKTEFVNTVKSLEATLSAHWAGPLPGKMWNVPGDEKLQFTCIAPGVLPGEPEQQYWLGTSEVTIQTARKLLNKTFSDTQHPDLPVTEISWNDRIDICRKLTEQAHKNGTLPPGFIFRMPYASEWQFAMTGAWSSAANFVHEQQSIKNFAWYGGNSMYQLHPVKTLEQGGMGLYDMIGNAAESVLIKPTVAGTTPQPGNYGGSFRDRRISSEITKLADPDMLQNKWSGLRLVLGRGTMDYFENNWYTGREYRIEEAGTVYELLGGPGCRWDSKSAAEWCDFLGGRVAQLKSQQLRRKLYNTTYRLQEMASFAGAEYRNGKWMWLDNTPIDNGEWLANEQQQSAKGLFLIWDHGFWRSNNSETVPLLILEHKKGKKTPRINNFAQRGIVLKHFKLNNKTYLLMQAPVNWYTARRLAELMGGRLAVPANAKEKAEFLKNLKGFEKRRIALGGFRKNGKWMWLNGTQEQQILPPDKNNRNESLNNCFAAIYNNRYCHSPEFDTFLCELQ